ncbi:hypothetical protein PG985_012594 [Apiospora marii]|uniref:uncharacterized protein n=1 Tax=Apiospora marii TaxID=335849 RepID=UPI00312DD460
MPGAINLLSFPNELLREIFDAVQEKTSLAAAARTCHQLRDFAEARLYSHLSLETRGALEVLEKLVESRPQRAGFLRQLDLVFATPRYDNDRVGVTTAGVVASCPGIKSLTIESPRCNARSRDDPSEWGTDWPADMALYQEQFESASLLSEPSSKGAPFQNLTSRATDRLWYTTPSCPVFLLPNLEKLEVSCAVVRFTETDRELQRFEGKTKLKALAFTESSVDADSLDALLKLPKELLRLELYEPASLMGGVWPRNQPIRLSSNSLRHLSLSIRSLRPPSNPSTPHFQLDLSALPSLESLQVGPFLGPFHSPLQERWPLLGQLPRNLASLRLSGFDARTLRRRNTIVTDLRVEELLSFPRDDGRRFSIVIDLTIPNPSQHRQAWRTSMRSRIRQFAEQVAELQPSEGVGLEGDECMFELQVTTARQVRFVPPYLYGEKRPQRVVRYSSSRPEHDRFLARPYFEETGMPEDEADLHEQDTHVIGMFAIEEEP